MLTVETPELRRQGLVERYFLRVLNWIKEEYRLTNSARIRSKAENGDARAQYLLGSLCESGAGALQHLPEAVKWYQKAAFQGVAQAQLALGLKYLHGQGVAQNDMEALLWLRKAGEQGQAEAQYQLGNLHREGKGTPRDLLQASKWYRKAAERGHLEAKRSFKELTSATWEVPEEASLPEQGQHLAG